MPACGSTFDPRSKSLTLVALLLVFAGLSVGAPHRSFADVGTESQSLQPEDEDLKGSPYTEYGEFNEQVEEEEVTRFLQYGRFFGVSLGAGLSGVTGNRGSVYQGGFPSPELKLHYWFDFDFALEIGVAVSSHYFQTQVNGQTDVTLLRVGADLKYYIPVYNLAAPITFANPYLTFGFGSFTKNDRFQAQEAVDAESSFGLTLGGGLEFVLSPRRSSFYISAKAHVVNFDDTFTTIYQPEGLQDLTGTFYSFAAGVLFTW